MWSEHISHDYCVVIRRLQVEEGGGYAAWITQLGNSAFNSGGETPAEALNSLQELYDWMKDEFTKDKDWEWPEPMDEDCIVFREVENKMSMEEADTKFKGYLAEATIKLVKREKGE